jgi:putative hemolysin
MLHNNTFLTDLLMIFIIIVINSLFVLSEISILTSGKAKLHKMSAKGNRGAKQAIKLIQQPEVFLSTMQIGITLMSALLGLYGGTSISEHLAKKLEYMPYVGIYIADYSMLIASFISLSIITYFAVLSEIVPKRIAMLQPEKIASVTSHYIAIIIKMAYPLSVVLTISTKFLLNLFRIKDNTNNVSIEEIKFILNQAVNVGTLHKTEHDLLRRLINLINMQVGAIMTPRNKIISLDISDNEKSNIAKLKKYNFNFFPVINGSMDQLIGVVSIKALFNYSQVTNAVLYERAKASNVVYIPEMARITKLIDLFSVKHVKTAFVLDEYGDIEGVVTLNDVMRTFLGDLAILMDGKKPGIVNCHDGSFVVDGNISIEELFELLQISSLPGDDEENYRTLASFMLRQLGTLPKINDIITAEGCAFKILKMDKKRIDRVLIVRENIIDEKSNEE